MRKVRKPERAPDIHGSREAANRILHRLRDGAQLDGEPPLGAAERAAVLEFLQARRDEVSDSRFRTYAVRLPQAAARIGPEFLRPSRDAPARFKEAFPAERYARASRESSWYVLMTFWRWRSTGRDKEVPAYLTVKFPTNGTFPTIPAREILTREDVTRIAQNSYTTRDRAWVWALFESRCRPGEVFSLRVGDVEPRDGYAVLHVRREKGSDSRPAPIYADAVPSVLAWVAEHPRRTDPGAPLWVSFTGHGKGPGHSVTYREMCKVVEEAARRAQITKPIHPYAFRHAGLTWLAKQPGISPAIFAATAGWVQGSDRVGTYVALANSDVERALSELYGVSPKEPGEKPQAAAQCGRCKLVNPPDANYCRGCGGPLTLAATRSLEAARSDAHELKELLTRPEVVSFLSGVLRKNTMG